MKPVILLILAFTVVVVAFVVQPIEYLMAAFVIDDGLYYLEVPRNIAAGYGVTYDNRTFTNGFHPLWGAIGLIMAAATGGDTNTLLRTAFVVQGLFVLIGLACLGWITSRLEFALLGTVAAMLLLFFARLDLWLSTMESATLFVSLLVLVAVAIGRNLLGSQKTTNNILLGVLLFAVFMARLDTIFIVFAFLLVQLVFGVRNAGWRRGIFPVLKTGIVFTLISAPYLIANKVYFGSIVPVSGVKKTGGSPHLLENIYALWQNMAGSVANKLGVPTLIVVLAVVMAAGGIVWLCLRPAGRHVLTRVGGNVVLTALLIGILARCVYLLLFFDEYTRVPWYWVPEYLLVAVAVGNIITLLVELFQLKWVERRSVVYGVAIVLFVGGCIYLVKDAAAFQRTNQIQYQTAIWARDNVSEDKLFAMVDSGIFAYFSERDVIPLNGLITDTATMEQLSRKRYKEVMERFHVDYYVHMMKEHLDIPAEIILHHSPTIPRGIFAGMRIYILDYGTYPETTAKFLPRED